MILMLNPEPLPPRAEPVAIHESARLDTLISPIGPRGCPTCTSGVFRLWGSSVVEWTADIA